MDVKPLTRTSIHESNLPTPDQEKFLANEEKMLNLQKDLIMIQKNIHQPFIKMLRMNSNMRSTIMHAKKQLIIKFQKMFFFSKILR